MPTQPPPRVPRRITFSMELPPLPPGAPVTDLSLDMLRALPIHPEHRASIRFHADQVSREGELLPLVNALGLLLDLLPAGPPAAPGRRLPAPELRAPKTRPTPPRSRPPRKRR